LTFTINVQQDGKYNIAARLAAPNIGGSIGVGVDGGPLTVVSVLATGGYQSWGTQSIGKYDLTAGTHILKTAFFFGGFNVNYFDIAYVGAMSINDEQTLPKQFALEQNYPNPFNPATTINYTIPVSNHATITVKDILGKAIATIVNERKAAGSYSVKFDASDLVAGIYFYTLRAGEFQQTKKLIVIK
jgi:hypothetical protein